MKKVTLIALALILLSSINTAFSAETSFNVYTPSVYKQNVVRRLPKKIVGGDAIELLVDYSGSMRSWIKLAVETLEYVIPKMKSSSYIALRTFGGHQTGMSACKTTRLETNFKDNNNAAVIRYLNQAKTGGATPIEYSLRKVVEDDFTFIKTERNSKKKIVLVTDGEETCGGNPCEYIKQLMASRNDIVIDVVLVGGTDKLKCLAMETGGKYYQIKNLSEKVKFENAFEQSFGVAVGTVQQGRKNNNSTPSSQSPTGRGYRFINY